jgi:flagellar hook protein FlgE
MSSSISDIAGSALQAFSKSQQATAYNISNLNTDGFKTSKATFQENGSGGGVSATAASTQDSVDISSEAVNLLSNAEGFKANINVLKTEDEMSKVLFSIKA